MAVRMGEKRVRLGPGADSPAPLLPAHGPTSPSTLSVAMHLCPALSLMRSILGASMRQLQRGNSSNPRSVSREDVSLDTPWTKEKELREALLLTYGHPWWGLSSPPCFSLPDPEFQSLAMDTPAPVGSPSSPFRLALRPPPSSLLSQQLAITSVVGGEGPLAGQLQGPQRDLHVLTGA